MIHTSTLPEITVPNCNLSNFVFKNAAKNAQTTASSHEAFVDSITQTAITLAQLEHQTISLATGLQTYYGLGVGDTVAIFAGNSIVFPIVAYAIVSIGAICTPANPSYTPQELAHQLVSSHCKAVIVGDGLGSTVDRALQLSANKHCVEHVLRMDESRSLGTGSIFDIMIEDEEEDDEEDGENDWYSRQNIQDYRDMPAYLCYSSGTTGKPKGVLLTHGNMISNALQINTLKQLDIPDPRPPRFLGLAPFCHAYGLSYVLHSSIILGGTVIVMAAYSFDRFLQSIQQHSITHGYLVPPLISALAKDARVDGYDLSSMRTVLSGGAALSPALIEAAETRLPGLRIVQGYGMSEMAPAVTMLATTHGNPSSVGILLSNCAAKVIDDSGHALPIGQTGELCFRGPNIMLGYLDNKQATDEIIDQEKFLHTGDIGHIDNRGFFYVTDRKKELIKYKGFQVAPAELEALLSEHPAVEDAAVMPVYDDAQATEIPRAYLVLKKNASADCTKEVVAWLHERVAPYKRLRGGVVLVDSIPRSPAGKIIRASLRNIEHVSSQNGKIGTIKRKDTATTAA